MKRLTNRPAYITNYWLAAFIFFIIIPAALGLLWLSLGILVIAGSYKILQKACNYIKKPTLKSVAKNVLLAVYIFIVSISLNLFVVEIYSIPSVSMENTLLTGDYILVNKLVYGPKLVRNAKEVSWLNFLLKPDNESNKDNQKPYNHKRAKGISKIKRGDIIVFKLYDEYIVVKRCIALAGDTLNIINGDIYVNGKKYASAATVKEKYKLIFKNKKTYKALVDAKYRQPGQYHYNFQAQSITGIFTRSEISKLQPSPFVKVVKVIETGQKNHEVFAAPPQTSWTIDNMGPIVIPKKGLTIRLTAANYPVYQKIINNTGHVKTDTASNTVVINGKHQTHYTFKENYFFMMGDNRKEAMDSRFFGFIADEQIIGKSPLILFSNHDNKFKWDRFLKPVF
ncbi:MAG: signal peptidase I [Sphingobacteriaceae bacterium]|nr:MAG: signal peptidase I [Sphingobacteriaceae bacterium]